MVRFHRSDGCNIDFEVGVEGRKSILRIAVIIDIKYGAAAVRAVHLHDDVVGRGERYLFPVVSINGGIYKRDCSRAALRISKVF
jgi:hypothetical protein